MKTPGDKLDVYFNDDGGSGPFPRSVGRRESQMAAIFKSWIEPIKDLHIVAVSGGDQFRPTTSEAANRPRFRGWPQRHRFPARMGWSTVRVPTGNADTYDRVQKDDVMQDYLIEAWFVYNAATRAEMLPRIPTPAPDPAAKSHE